MPELRKKEEFKFRTNCVEEEVEYDIKLGQGC